MCTLNAWAGDDDLHFQPKAGVSFKLNEVWKMTVTEEGYYTDSGRLYVHESDVGLEYSGLADWLALSCNFRYIESNPDGGHWVEEYRPHFNVKIKSKLGDFPWSNRARIEYRDFKERKDAWRLRNFLVLDMPFTLPVLDARPYIGDESHFVLSENGFSENRVYAGLKFKLFKNLRSDVYYYWGKSQKPGRWDELSVVGCELIWEF
jgi:hypothetical protein